MNIREITTSDSVTLATIRRLLAQLTTTPVTFTLEQLDAIVCNNSSHLLLAYDAHGVAVGMTTVAMYPTPSGLRAWVEDVVVDNTCRGMGYGKGLVEHAIKLSQELGAKTIALTSHPSRIAANELYRSLGFAVRHTNLYRMEL